MGWLNTAIGAGAGFLVGGPAGAAVGAGIGSGVDTNQAIADRADSSNAWSAQQYATKYQTTVKDMEAAGLNPMLAYSQGAGTAPTAKQVSFQNPVSSGMQALSQYGGFEQSIASANQANQQVNLIKATTTQVYASVDKIIEETKKIPLEAQQIKYVIQKLAEEAANIAQDTHNKVVLRESMTAGIKKINVETGLLHNQLQVEESLNNLGRTSKELAPAAKFLLDLYRSTK